jgi:hypothetical protein
MPAGDNGAIRITTDVFQNTNPAQNTYYQGWVIRAKYAYLQYTGLRNEFGPGSSLVGRLGLLHTVMVDYEEQYWPRYLQQTAIEKNGFFSSSDMGLAGLATLGNRWGEIYGTVTNGSGYTSYDNPGAAAQAQAVGTNRFKDFGIRASITPFGQDGPKPVELPPQHLRSRRGGYLGCNGSARSSPAGEAGEGREPTARSPIACRAIATVYSRRSRIRRSAICVTAAAAGSRLGCSSPSAGTKRQRREHGRKPRVAHDSRAACSTVLLHSPGRGL